MATTPNYDINYDDQRFKDVENEKNAQMSQMNNAYNEMINSSDKYYQDQKDALEDYKNQQTDLQNQQTQLTIDQINQQKDQAHKDYLKEQKGSYVDWQKQSNQYGANAESMASQGLTGTGFSESSQVSMYNTYQNRVSVARDTFSKAILTYDNSIKEAQLQNSSKLAEIAYNALQKSLELSLQGFQYKNTLIEAQINKQQEIDNTYYQRWQNVQQQINTENQLAENVRQYNEEMAYKQAQLEEAKRQAAQEQANWEKEYALALKEYNLSAQKAKASSSGSSGSSSTKLSNGSSGSSSSGSSSLTGNKNYSTAQENGISNLSKQEYNNILKVARTTYNAGKLANKTKAKQAVYDYLASTKASESDILKILNQLGIK